MLRSANKSNFQVQQGKNSIVAISAKFFELFVLSTYFRIDAIPCRSILCQIISVHILFLSGMASLHVALRRCRTKLQSKPTLHIRKCDNRGGYFEHIV